MFSWLMNGYCQLPRWSRRPLWRWLHGYLDSRDDQARVLFMNYGYSSDESDEPLRLTDEDEPERYCIQLYNRIVSAIDVRGKSLLEVGCGPGALTAELLDGLWRARDGLALAANGAVYIKDDALRSVHGCRGSLIG